MSDVVVDSSVLIDHLRGSPKATQFLEREVRTGRVLVPALAAWELWKGANTPRRRTGVSEILTMLEVEPFGPAMAQLAGELHRLLSESGRTPPAFDLLIAAHALHLGVPLATRNRDYSRISGLQVNHVPK